MLSTVIAPSPRAPQPKAQPKPLLKRISQSYKETWKPLMAAKTHLDEEYNFASGPRRGAEQQQHSDPSAKEFGYSMK